MHSLSKVRNYICICILKGLSLDILFSLHITNILCFCKRKNGELSINYSYFGNSYHCFYKTVKHECKNASHFFCSIWGPKQIWNWGTK